MFYFFGGYRLILAVAAIAPAVFLIKYIYKLDRLEKEPTNEIIVMAVAGMMSTYIAVILETVGSFVMEHIGFESYTAYYLFEFFIVVGPAEEFAKFLMFKARVWKNPQFNCQFDAIVYATTISLGFALWENIRYVFSYGFSTALIRAVTAVPGHACFGVFMGVWLGVAKRLEILGNAKASKTFRFIAWFMPAVIHGAYDYIATVYSGGAEELIFVAFIAVMFLICFKVIKHLSKKDRYLDPRDNFIDL